MKLDIKIETAENGYVLTINQRKYVFKNERYLARMIINHVTGNAPFQQYGKEHRERISQGSKLFQSKVISKFQKEICKIIERDGYSTIDKLTDELYPKKNYKTDKSTFRSVIRKAIIGLTKKGFVKRPSGISKKYHLTGKMPKGYVDFGKKIKEV